MKAILQHKSKRTKFLWIVGVILFIIFLIRVYVIPTHFPNNTNETLIYLKSVLDKISISLIVSLFLGWFLFKIEVPEDESKFEIIEPKRIADYFDKGRINTSFWYFSGGLGRFTRTVTIPKIAELSQNNNSSKTIRMNIINPMDKECTNYSDFKNSLKSAKESKINWTSDFVKNQTYATIFKSIIYKSHFPMLEIDIYLKKVFNTTRIDQNESNCIVTKEDKRDLGLICTKDTFLYKTYKEEIFQESKQSIKFTIDKTIDNVNLKKSQLRMSKIFAPFTN
ncbi:hypothetical protein QLS71_002520 [Mariniflexile litorale]|uniref:SMODS-associating 2TM beta-strand rich effector domain-containing protein n=1 Tax=Mariniflexile litorale TaxID=3045158 RepID=A0AAU7EIQ7_9FLAO